MNITTIQHSMNGGEMSPRMEAREDQNKRQSALYKCENWQPITTGGVKRCDGTIFVQEAKVVADHPVKIIRSFRAANDASYVLEFGHQYVRIFKDGAYIGVELATPYTDSDLPRLYTRAQSIDVKYLFHPNYPTQKIIRTGPVTFVFSAVSWNPPATHEEEPTGSDLGGGTLTPAATSGTGILFTASAGSPFNLADVGRLVVAGSGRGLITARPTANTLTVTILDAFASTAPISAGNWRLTLSPQATIDVEDNKKEVGEVATLTASIALFRTADVGKWISIFGGLVKIDSLGGAAPSTTATATIKAALTDIDTATPAPTRAWAMEVSSWTALRGYPSCGTFFDGRLYAFSGLQCDGSQVDDYENFSKGGGDADAIQRIISDDDIDPIVWAVGLKGLLIGTGSGVFLVDPGSNGEPVTPSNFHPKLVSDKGAAAIEPIRISGLVHYVQYGQRRLREVVYDFGTDRYKAPNLLLLSDHLTESYYLTEIFYAEEPDSLVYGVRSDGTLLQLVYQEEESVMGWAARITDGLFKSGCCIPRPSTGKSWTWIIVERDNGTFIEYLEPDRLNSGREWNQIQTDSAKFLTYGAGFVITGLDHLEGQTVKVIGDGKLYDDALVAGGQITVSPPIAADTFEVGLPYTSTLETMPPIIPAELGGPLAAAGYSEIGIRFRKTLGLKVNGETITHRKTADAMDEQVPLQKGKRKITNLGYAGTNRISVVQDEPLPAELLNVFGKLSVGNRWAEKVEDDASPPFSFIGGTDPIDPSAMFTIDIVINTNKVDYVLYDALVAAGWNRVSPVTCTLTKNAGAKMTASSSGSYAFDTGAPLPMGSPAPILTFIGMAEADTVEGKAGNGGLGGLGAVAGGSGDAGGDAMAIRYDCTINVNAGLIRGGPGAGGGGGGGEAAV